MDFLVEHLRVAHLVMVDLAIYHSVLTLQKRKQNKNRKLVCGWIAHHAIMVLVGSAIALETQEGSDESKRGTCVRKHFKRGVHIQSPAALGGPSQNGGGDTGVADALS